MVQESDVIALNPGQSTEIQFSWDLTQYNNRKYVYLAISSSKASGGSPVTDSSEDRHGGTYDTATNIYAPPVISGIKGRINQANDIDMLKFKATSTSPHTLVNTYTSTVRMAIYSTAYGITLIDDKVMSPGTSFQFGSTAGEDYYIKIYDYWGVGNYEFWISQPESEIGVSDLQFSKNQNSNFIYVNNPEYITRYDIVDDSYTGIARKLSEQKNVSGKNTYYQTHVAWWGANSDKYEPTQSFYTDVDFYNPTNQTVTVSVSNLAYGAPNDSNHTADYAVLQYYYSGGVSTTITIPPYEHRLLFESLNAPMLTTHPGGNTAWSYERLRPLSILFDFEVSGSSGITVSSLAAYNRNYLYLRNGSENIVDLNNKTLSCELLYSILNEEPPTGLTRPNEPDIYQKYKGIAQNQSAWIDANLNYVIDDSLPSGQMLNVNLKDAYYPDGVYSPRDWWMSHTNPLYDSYHARFYMMPSGLHQFTYPYNEYRQWVFDFEHRDARNPNLNGGVNESVNNPVPSNILETVKQEAKTGQYITPFGTPPDEYALGIGEWGATYHYTIAVNNVGNNARNIEFRIRNADNLIAGYKLLNEGTYQTSYVRSYGEEGEGLPVASILVPAKTSVVFEVVTMLGGGHTGLNNFLIVN